VNGTVIKKLKGRLYDEGKGAKWGKV